MIRAMGRSAVQTVDSFGFGSSYGGVSYYDEAGNLLDPSQLSPGMQRAIGEAIGRPASSAASVSSPFDTMGSFVIVIGLLLCVAGLLLAWYLYTLNRKK